MSSTVVSSPIAAHVLGIEARCGDRFEGAARGIEQPDGAGAVGDVRLERLDEQGRASRGPVHRRGSARGHASRLR